MAAVAGVAVACGLAMPTTAGGHHSVLGFDTSRQVRIAGTITRVVWQNPHVHVEVEVAGAPPERWSIEAESANLLRRIGWSEAALAPGMPIRVTGAQARDGALVLRCESVQRLDDSGRPAGLALPCIPPSN